MINEANYEQTTTQGTGSGIEEAESTIQPTNPTLNLHSSTDEPTTLLPRPPTAPSKSSNPNFSLIQALARDPSLLPHLISFLSIPSIISLYAICKPFHYHFNLHHTASILTSTRTWAPDADTIFPWRCYKRFCIKDPAQITKARLQGREAEVKEKWGHIREVPSLRWLQMVVWREGVVQDMLIVLRAQGLLCPPGTLTAVKRMWFLMDFPLNSQRLALIRDKKYFPDGVLVLFTMFLLKVDMLLTDPLQAAYPIDHPNRRFYPRKDNGSSVSGVGLRKLLLAERQLTPLWRVIRGWTPDPKECARPMTRLDMLRLWVRHKYKPKEELPEATKKMSIMGIPWFEVGTAGLERTGLAVVAAKKEHDDKEMDGYTTKKPVQPAVVLSNPSILPTASTTLQQDQLNSRSKIHAQPRRSQPDEVLPPAVLSTGKPRELLLRPDELVMRETLRRGFKNHEMWAKWMLWGFCGPDGQNLPLLSEEEWMERLRGRKRGNGTEEGAVEDAVGSVGVGRTDAGSDEVDGKARDDDDEDKSGMSDMDDEEDDEDMSGMSEMDDKDGEDEEES